MTVLRQFSPSNDAFHRESQALTIRMFSDNCYDTTARAFARNIVDRSLHPSARGQEIILSLAKRRATIILGTECVEYTAHSTNAVSSSMYSIRSRYLLSRRLRQFAVQRNDARCVQQQFRRRFLGRNCRHRRPINITSIVAFLHSPGLSCIGP